jgi:hypothetical protein
LAANLAVFIEIRTKLQRDRMDPKDTALRVAALEKEVALLRAEVEAMRAGRAATLRTRGRCPACGSTSPLAIARKSSCATCGCVEWYVSSFEGIEIDGEKVKDASAVRPPDGAPYR